MAVSAKKGIEWDARGMSLPLTLLCGQTFSWRREAEDCFVGAAGPYAARARQRGGALLLEKPGGGDFSGEERDFWHGYFALGEDYAEIHRRLCADGTLAACVAAAPGIRVLRQPFFDTLLSFIISQNNHIPRIMGIVGRLREGFGPSLAGGERGFPAPGRLAALCPEDLAPLRAGFRAKYLIDAARRVQSGEVDPRELCGMDDAGAQAALRRITGVGPKVADCVLLFALGRRGVAPMDVWMKRAMAAWFPHGMPACAAGYEGIAQQYIFHRMRTEGR